MLSTAKATLHERAQFWNVTEAERRQSFPCDRYAEEGWLAALRGIDVVAPVATTFRWVCQVKIAPYSYDWIDHRGHRSPRTLTPGAEQLEIGQPMMLGTITEFSVDEHITGVVEPQLARRIGPIAMSYVTRPLDHGDEQAGTRLLVCLRMGHRNLAQRALQEALLWGDLVMMRKQLLVLKECAERTAREVPPPVT